MSIRSSCGARGWAAGWSSSAVRCVVASPADARAGVRPARRAAAAGPSRRSAGRDRWRLVRLPGLRPGHVLARLLRCGAAPAPADGLVFESLGLAGREDATAAALAALVGDAGRGAARTASPTIAIGRLSPPARPAGRRGRAPGRGRAGDRSDPPGRFYQLNLCTRLTRETSARPRRSSCGRPSGSGRRTGADLGRRRPTDATTLVSLSPELFLSVHDGRDHDLADQGHRTARADPDGSRAAVVGQGRRREHHDHRPDAQRPVPGVRAGHGAVDGLLSIQPHPGVWHLVSTVTGRLRAREVAADLLAATFPPGSVTGAPKIAARRDRRAGGGRRGGRTPARSV